MGLELHLQQYFVSKYYKKNELKNYASKLLNVHKNTPCHQYHKHGLRADNSGKEFSSVKSTLTTDNSVASSSIEVNDLYIPSLYIAVEVPLGLIVDCKAYDIFHLVLVLNRLAWIVRVKILEHVDSFNA